MPGQFGGAVASGVPVGDLVRGGKGKLDLLRCHRFQQKLGHSIIEGGCGHRPATGHPAAVFDWQV